MNQYGDAAQTILSGPAPLAVLVAIAAGVVSFASPCVLPLVPGFLGYVAGQSGQAVSGSAVVDQTTTQQTEPANEAPNEGKQGANLTPPARRVLSMRSRTLLGTALFVLGFTTVFVLFGFMVGGLGLWLRQWDEVISRVLGVVVITLGLIFMGVFPALSQRQWRLSWRPAAGLAGAPLLGAVFAVGWQPCLGPVLAAVNALALTGPQASPGRAAMLSVAYCVGLGLPFLLVAAGIERAMGALEVFRRHRVLIGRLGGGMLVVVGLLLVLGWWTKVIDAVRLPLSAVETLL